MPVIQNETALNLDKIIVATDFTPESEKALAYARALAHQFDSKLTLAHVIDLSIATPNPDAVVGIVLDQLRHDCAENLNQTLSDLDIEGINVSGRTLEAHNLAGAIVDLSEDLDADLIVIGTHHRRGFSKLILGSCSEGVIHSAKCPVLTIGPNVSAHSSDTGFRSIVFATDLKHQAIEKAAVALAFAKESIADVHICHIIEDPANSFSETFGQQARAEAALSRLIPDASYNWCSPKPSVLIGNIDKEILKIAKDTQADLIVLGAHRGNQWVNRFWGGVVEDVIGQAECPVLTICTESAISHRKSEFIAGSEEEGNNRGDLRSSSEPLWDRNASHAVPPVAQAVSTVRSAPFATSPSRSSMNSTRSVCNGVCLKAQSCSRRMTLATTSL